MKHGSAVSKELLVDLIKNFGKSDGKGGFKDRVWFAAQYKMKPTTVMSLVAKLRREGFGIPLARTPTLQMNSWIDELKKDYADKLVPQKPPKSNV